MCLSAMASPARRRMGRIGNHASRDVGATIEPGADPNVQTLAVGTLSRQAGETLGFRSRGCKRKPGRSPRALSHSVRAGALERIEAGAHLEAGEAAAALFQREAITEK